MSQESTSIEIQEVDPFDEDELATWHATMESVRRDGLGDLAAVWALPELRIGLQEPTRRRWQAAYVARQGGRVVGVGWLATPLLDNLDSAEVSVEVPAEERRRGVGSAILAHLEDEAGRRGRTRLDAEAAWPSDLGSDGAGWPAVEFALAKGYRLSLGDVQRELTLPVADALLVELAAEAAPHHQDFTLRTWVDDVPDDLAESWLALSSTLMVEAPTGDKEIETEALDVDTMRESEALLKKQGRTRYSTVALDPAGEVVAYTDLGTTVHEPGRAYQWGTLVRRDARGHRLGLAVKVANLQLFQRERDDVERIFTWNAEVNSHMIGCQRAPGIPSGGARWVSSRSGCPSLHPCPTGLRKRWGRRHP